LPHALARQPEGVADGGQRHRRRAVETEPVRDDRAPLRGEGLRGARDERGIFGSDERVERRPGHGVDEDVLPAHGASRADRLVERDVVALARLPVP